MAKMHTSIKSIADKLGLSAGTVSIVLNGRGTELRVSAQTQQRVLAMAQEMNYVPNMYAKRLRQSSGKAGKPIVVVFWPTGSNPILIGRFFMGLQQVTAYQEQQVEITLQPYQHGKLHLHMDAFSRNLYSGAVLMGLSEEDVAFINDHDFPLPLVLFNRLLSHCGSVYIDDFEIGAKAAALFSTRGHRHVGIVAFQNPSRSAQLKLSGFATTALELGLSLPQQRIAMVPQTYEAGADAMRQLMDFDPAHPVTAVFFQESVQAVGALRYLHKQGIRVPEDLEILSYGDNPQDAFIVPSLTSIHMPIEEMSRDCLLTVLRMIEKPGDKPSTIIHPFDFVFRESCGDFHGTFAKPTKNV
jgi:DNA-binding LacI/PurR family transcriptional regulator